MAVDLNINAVVDANITILNENIDVLLADFDALQKELAHKFVSLDICARDYPTISDLLKVNHLQNSGQYVPIDFIFTRYKNRRGVKIKPFAIRNVVVCHVGNETMHLTCDAIEKLEG